MKILATIQANNDTTKDTVYSVFTSKDWNMYCRDCGILFEFSDGEIDYSKSLPHITCPNCQKELQLPSKYLKKN